MKKFIEPMYNLWIDPETVIGIQGDTNCNCKVYLAGGACFSVPKEARLMHEQVQNALAVEK